MNIKRAGLIPPPGLQGGAWLEPRLLNMQQDAMHGTVLQNPSEAWTGSTIITGVGPQFNAGYMQLYVVQHRAIFIIVMD